MSRWKKTSILLGVIALIALSPMSQALIVDDAFTPGRVVNGQLISDRDKEPEVVVGENIMGSGAKTIAWPEVTTDSSGNPITVISYELRYRLVGETDYTLVVVPAEFSGHALTLPVGNYEGYVEAVDSDGNLSAPGAFTFTIN